MLTVIGRRGINSKLDLEPLAIDRAPMRLRQARKPQWLKPELMVRVRHLAGSDTLRHASMQGLADACE